MLHNHHRAVVAQRPDVDDLARCGRQHVLTGAVADFDAARFAFLIRLGNPRIQHRRLPSNAVPRIGAGRRYRGRRRANCGRFNSPRYCNHRCRLADGHRRCGIRRALRAPADIQHLTQMDIVATQIIQLAQLVFTHAIAFGNVVHRVPRHDAVGVRAVDDGCTAAAAMAERLYAQGLPFHDIVIAQVIPLAQLVFGDAVAFGNVIHRVALHNTVLHGVSIHRRIVRDVSASGSGCGHARSGVRRRSRYRHAARIRRCARHGRHAAVGVDAVRVAAVGADGAAVAAVNRRTAAINGDAAVAAAVHHGGGALLCGGTCRQDNGNRQTGCQRTCKTDTIHHQTIFLKYGCQQRCRLLLTRCGLMPRKDFTVLSVRRQCFKGIRAASKSGCFRAKRQSVRVRSNPLAAA